MTQEKALLQVRGLEKAYGRGAAAFRAISDISFDIFEGETLGIVGESGCGKSTMGRSIVQLPPPSGGTVHYNGRDLTELSQKEMRVQRSELQIIFQDPVSSLNPRRKIKDIVAEPLVISGLKDEAELTRRVRETLTAVGVNPDSAMDKRPHEFSGGQCQRICIARALIQEPKLIVCDEPVSALDVSVQAQILNLMEDMKAQYGLTLMFISHDLAVVKNISDRVVVMYLGNICEIAPSQALYDSPAHPYTRGLMACIPDLSPQSAEKFGDVLRGEIPSPLRPPSGCRFRTRCPKAQPVCAELTPELVELAPNHFAACHFPEIGLEATS